MASIQLKDPMICPLHLIATVIILPGMMTGTQETLQPPPPPPPGVALWFWTSAFPPGWEVMVLPWKWSQEGLIVGNLPTNTRALSPPLPCLSQFLCPTGTLGPRHVA